MEKFKTDAASDRFALFLWVFQRITAFLVFLALGLHIHTVHYADLGQPILFAGVALRLKTMLSFVCDISLLFLALFHGLNGLRAVLLDLSFFNKYEKIITLVLFVVGIIFAIWGVRGLWAFILIRS